MRTRDIEALTAPFAVPAVHVIHTPAPSRSYFGGSPRLPADIAWPEKAGRRLGFLARLSLADLQATQSVDWLPKEGALLYFYDLDEQPWGFDPKDRGGFAVLHVPDLPAPVDALRERGETSIPQHNATFRPILSRPSGERDQYRELKLSEREFEDLAELEEEVFRDHAWHQVAGFPSPVQGDIMELECQLVSHGLYCGDARGYQDPRAKELSAGAANWRLLLQFDSDDALEVMWGDLGRLYFWVEEQKAKAGDFSNAWLVCQCH